MYDALSFNTLIHILRDIKLNLLFAFFPIDTEEFNRKKSFNFTSRKSVTLKLQVIDETKFLNDNSTSNIELYTSRFGLGRRRNRRNRSRFPATIGYCFRHRHS